MGVLGALGSMDTQGDLEPGEPWKPMGAQGAMVSLGSMEALEPW
jgi:hypothetical protein